MKKPYKDRHIECDLIANEDLKQSYLIGELEFKKKIKQLEAKRAYWELKYKRLEEKWKNKSNTQ